MTQPRLTIEPSHAYGALPIALTLVLSVRALSGASINFTPVFWSAIVLTLGLLALLWIVPPRIGEPLARTYEGIGEAILWLIVFAMLHLPGILAYVASREVVTRFPYLLQMAIMILWMLALAVTSVLMYSRSLRLKTMAWWNTSALVAFRFDTSAREISVPGAITLYVNFVFIAMGGFAAFVSILHDPARPLFLPGPHTQVSHGTLADFFGWHVLDAIPGLKVNETILWKVPLTYERAGAGWLLLLFKVMVIVPAVRGIGRYLKEEDKPEASTSERG